MIVPLCIETYAVQVDIKEFYVKRGDREEDDVIYKVYVGGNTGAAEQCFSQLRKSTPTLRGLKSWAAQLLVAFRVHYMNSKRCSEYGVEVNPQGPLSTRWNPCRTLGQSVPM